MKLPSHLAHAPLIPAIDCAAMPPSTVFQQAAMALLEQGVVKLQRCFDPGKVSAWREQFEQHTLRAVRVGRYPYRLAPLGDRRHHYTIEIHRTFNDPAFYANRFVYGTAMAVMDRDFIMATAAISYAEPRAPAQYTHRDQRLLFSSERLNGVLPPVSLTVSVPLVATGDVVGGTEFAIGSHRQGSEADPHQFARSSTALGDCLLWDSRLIHRGCENPGSVARPIALLYYQRPWYFNFGNYSRDCEIKITRENLARVPAEYTHLFEWCHTVFQPPVFSAMEDGECSCGSGLTFADCHGRS